VYIFVWTPLFERKCILVHLVKICVIKDNAGILLQASKELSWE
jgi:hypothetical protein